MIKILIAEDDSILALYFKSLLIDLGHEEGMISIADTGKKASRMSKKLKPQLVFMDITMESDSDGIDACRNIKKKDPSVKIVFVSAYPESSLSTKFNNVTYDDYLEKPFRKESIMRSLIKLGFYDKK